MENNKQDLAILRHKAESLLGNKISNNYLHQSDDQMYKLVHELQVHQVELEMQNDELNLAKQRSETVSQKYTELYDLAPIGYFTLSKEGDILELNLCGANMLGKDRSILRNSKFGFFVSDTSKPDFNHFLNRVFNFKVRETCELSLIGSGKLPVFVSVTGINIKNEEHCLVAITDITRYKLMDDRLQKNNSRLQLAMEFSDMAWWEMDITTGKFTFGSKMASMLGYPAEKFIHHKDFMDLVHPGDRELALKAFKDHFDGLADKYEFQYRILTKSEGYKWIRDIGSIVKKDADGIPLLVTGMVIDITRRKEAEEIVKQTEQRRIEILQTAMDGYWLLDLQGHLLEVNETYCHMSGYTSQELQSMQICDLEADEMAGITKMHLQKAIDQGEDRFETIHRRRDGSTFNVEVSIHHQRSDEVRMIVFMHDISSRKKSEELIKASESRFRFLVYDMQIGVILYGPKAEIILSNPKALELLDINGDQLIKKSSLHPDWKLIHEDGSTLNDYNLFVNQAIATGQPIRDVIIGVYRPSHGDLVWLIVNAEPRLNADGKVQKVVCTFIDITFRKLAEQQLRLSEQRLKYHFENSPLAVVEWDASFHVTQWSREAERIFGWEREEVIGKQISSLNLIFMEDIPTVNHTIERLTSGKELMVVSTNRNMTRSGDLINCTWYNSVLFDQKGQMTSVMSLVQDITKRKKNEEALRKLNEQLEERVFQRTVALQQSNKALQLTQEKYRTIADYTFDWEYWLNPEGEFTYVSPSCERISGYHANEFILDPKLLGRIIFNSDREIWKNYEKNAGISKSGELNSEFNFRIVTKSGDIRWIGCAYQKVFINDKYLGIRASNRDITDKINADNQLLNLTLKVEERERNHFSRELHDGLGPLLSTIKLYFHWLSESTDAEKAKMISEKGNHYIESAIQTTHNMALGLSSLVLTKLGYVKTVLNYAQSVKELRNIAVNFTFNSNDRFGYVLETALYRITSELINNTVKYARASKIEIVLNYQKDLSLISFSYSDNGIGFSLEDVEKSGSGLGLLNIQQRVNILKGKMQINTSTGRGVMVNIELPITQRGGEFESENQLSDDLE